MADSVAQTESALEVLAPPEIPPGQDVQHLRDLSSAQWKSGIAAWLGWLFDGMDMHLYSLVAAPFVAELLRVNENHPSVGPHIAVIQAGFLVGWALGGGFFGRLGDRIGRSKALMLTILTYACFTGLGFFAQTWWQLLIFRFLAALGIGGEWAVGASLLSETWPARWRPSIAAVLQSAVNVGVLIACVAAFALARLEHRYIFLIGVAPAFVVLWIRRAVPETEEWQAARAKSAQQLPGVADLWRGEIRRTTALTIAVCSLSMTAHWAFMFWVFQHLRQLPELADWTEQAKGEMLSGVLALIMSSAIIGNFMAAALARRLGYRRTISLLFVGFFLALLGGYGVRRTLNELLFWISLLGMSQGVFGLFTMYLPPLFPTLLRTTGAGFCYNIGRIVAAAGTMLFGLLAPVGDYRVAMLYAGVLVLPASAVALFMPELPAARAPVVPVE